MAATERAAERESQEAEVRGAGYMKMRDWKEGDGDLKPKTHGKLQLQLPLMLS
jgi:hypothetical protein